MVYLRDLVWLISLRYSKAQQNNIVPKTNWVYLVFVVLLSSQKHDISTKTVISWFNFFSPLELNWVAVKLFQTLFVCKEFAFCYSRRSVLLINGLPIVMIARKTEVHWLWAIDDVLNCVAYVKWNICNRIWHYLWYMIHMCWKFIVVKMPIVSIVRRSIYLISQPGNNEHWLFN